MIFFFSLKMYNIKNTSNFYFNEYKEPTITVISQNTLKLISSYILFYYIILCYHFDNNNKNKKGKQRFH